MRFGPLRIQLAPGNAVQSRAERLLHEPDVRDVADDVVFDGSTQKKVCFIGNEKQPSNYVALQLLPENLSFAMSDRVHAEPVKSCMELLFLILVLGNCHYSLC